MDPKLGAVEAVGLTSITIMNIFFAIVGAALAVTYQPTLTRRMAWGALLSGAVAGCLLPKTTLMILNIWWPTLVFPELLMYLLAVVYGILGMFLVPGVITIGQQIQQRPGVVVDWTFSFVDRLRGVKKDQPKEGS